jgi:hypothetical protein
MKANLHDDETLGFRVGASETTYAVLGCRRSTRTSRDHRQRIVHGCGGDRSLANGHSDLVEPADEIARSIEALHRGVLMLADKEPAGCVNPGARRLRKLGLRCGAEGGVNDIEAVAPAVVRAKSGRPAKSSRSSPLRRLRR